MNNPPRVLFLCTGNSCRSQMAEGWAKHLLDGVIEPYSAGIVAHGLNARAVKAMLERGIDISAHQSKALSEIDIDGFDLVITVCGHAHESCPVFPGESRVIHHGFDDPPRLAEGISDEELALAPYRRIRDEIEAFVRTIPELLQ